MSPSNTGVFDWGLPFGPSDSTSLVDVAPRTVGVYFAVTGVPFLSTRLTVTPFVTPTKSFSGVNVTFPSLSTV